MEIIEHSGNSHTMKFPANKENNHTVPFLLVSDVHYDSRKCQRDLLKKHFDHIKKQNGFIMCFGDWFDVMGCYRDPRSKSADIRPEYISQNRSYLDLIVEDSFRFLENYKNNLIFMSDGNHETAIKKHRDTDILNTLVFLLRQSGSKVVKGGYSGFINLSLFEQKRKCPYIIAYHHGKGGNAPRSKGILHMDIDFKNYPDSNLFVSGHNHQKGLWPSVCYRRKTSGKIIHDTRYWLKTGTYKRNESHTLMGGWEVEKGFDPTPLGGYYLNLELMRIWKDGKETLMLEDTFIDAK